MHNKNKRVIRILLTDVGHPVTPGVTQALKLNSDFTYYIVGVESSQNKAGALWTDKLYNIEDPSAKSYVKTLLDIAIKEQIDVVIPWTNAEVLAISKRIKLFNEKKIKVTCSSFETTKNLIDKGVMYKKLQDLDIPLPQYQTVSTIAELKKAVNDLGYPKKNVVIKPRNYSGGRGFYIVSKQNNLVTGHSSKFLPLEAIEAIIKTMPVKNQKQLDYLAMEYLEGEDFSVDTLNNDGKPLFIVQRKRLSDTGGVATVTQTDYHPQIYKYTEKIIKHFAISYNCNLQFKFRKDLLGEPLLYDINPRISGTVIANAHAGIDLVMLAIYQALGIEIDHKAFKTYKKMRLVRYWSEAVQYFDEEFSSRK